MRNLNAEVARYRGWANSFSDGRQFGGGEWECEYPNWGTLYRAVLDSAAQFPSEGWADADSGDILYAIARDNEMQHLVCELREQYPLLLLHLAEVSLHSHESDARWQIAFELGHLANFFPEAEQLLTRFAADAVEYVRRRALMALATLGSPAVEALALEARKRPDENQEYSRMVALECLEKIASPHLERLLAEAEQDGRKYLLQTAESIRADLRR